MAADLSKPGRKLVPLWLAAAILAFAAVLLHPDPVKASRASDPPGRLLIDKEATYAREAGALALQGLRVLEDYGAFVLAEPPEGMDARSLRSRGLKIRREIARGVRLRKRRITGAMSSRALPSAPTGEALYLVALGGPAKPAWVERIREAAHGGPMMALPESAYLAWLGPAEREALAASDSLIDFIVPVPAGDRLSPEIDSAGDPATVTVLFADTPRGRAAAEAAQARAIAVHTPAPRLAGLAARTLTLSRDAIDEISGWEEMVWMEPYRAPSTRDELSALITAGLESLGRPLGPQYRQWLAFHGLTDFSSYVVQVVDTGIDSGVTGIEHPALAGELTFASDETLEGSLEDCVGHGTNIAGIIAGSPNSSAALRDANGYELGLGVAPGAHVGASRIFTCAGIFQVRRDFGEILKEAYDLGARFSNNSWGTGGSSYSSLAREFDALVRDVDQDPANGDQQMSVIFAAGNKGPNPRTIDVPGVAKNVLTVGAVESYRPEATDGCGLGPTSADDAAQVREGSSRGPTVDGRLKPDLVAPGSHIISTASQSPSYTGLGVCDTFYPPGQRLYNWTSGTSQATAHVSGAAVVMSEEYRRRFGALPSPAMVKAALIATARDLGEASDDFNGPTAHRPANSQGWGRVDLTRVVESRDVSAFDQADILQSSGQQVVKGPFIVADVSKPVSIVTVWTDAPGTPAGSSWVNDLDLSVQAGGKTYLGNVLTDGFSVTGGLPDGKNNVESVFLPPGAATSLSVTVTATSLPGDGVPSSPGVTDQDFALYMDNVIEASPAGRIDFLGGSFDCSRTATLRVVDKGLAGGGRVRVLVSSSSEAQAEPVDLSEVAGRGGLFVGEVSLGAGAPAPDGVVQTADGDVLDARYEDVDDGTGSPRTVSATAGVTCTPLVLSNPRVETAGQDRVLMAWSTNRPADTVVTGNLGIDYHDPSLVTEHLVVIADLAECSQRLVTISSTDASGLTAVHPSTGSLRISTGSDRTIDLFFDDLETFRGGWHHSGPGDTWEIGTPIAGPPAAHSGRRVWGTNLSGPYDAAADIALESPPFDLRHLDSPVLSFWQFVQIPVAGSTGGPQDGAWVEISTDGGASWQVIAPVSGYPVPEGPNNPYVPNGSRVFAGTGAGWHEVRFDLSFYSGHAARVRFRLWRDPAAPAPDAGWYLDDVRVSAGLPCHRGVLTLDSDAYGCSGPVRVTLADTDLDVNVLKQDTAAVTVIGPSGTASVPLIESGNRTAMFTGSLALTPSAGGPGFRVAQGDALTFEYMDASDGSLSPATIRLTADVPDCTPPAPPSNLTAQPSGFDALALGWNDPPDPDLAEVRVYYDSDAPGPVYNGQGAAEGASPVPAGTGKREAALTGLPPCTPQFVSLTAVDGLGNESDFSAEAAAAPVGAVPCPHARLSVAPAGSGCAETVQVLVEDANADPDLSAPGVLTATAQSPSDPAPLAVTLTETGPATGVFSGPLALAPSPTAGALAVAEGDSVSLTYQDLDSGSGSPASVSATLGIVDCEPPVISNLRLDDLRTGSIGLSWETSEPSASIVGYGSTPALGSITADPALKTAHTATLPGSGSCGTIHYRIEAIDTHGNTAISDDAGLPHYVGLARDLALYSQSFESGPSGWTHSGAHDEWELGFPVAGPPPPLSGTNVWGLDLDDRYERDADTVLVSPVIDLTGVTAATLSFEHWYDIYTSSAPTGSGRDDGGWVEVSTDGGQTWTYITPQGGYPSTVAANPYIPGGSPAYAGTSSAWTRATFVLDPFTGGPVRVRFHFYMDRFPDGGWVPGYGWYIDDVEVHVDAACHQGRLRVSPPAPDCGDSPLSVSLWDVDLDTDPNAPDTVAVEATSPSDPSPLLETLTETGPATGVFSGSIPIASSGGPGVLRVSGGDEMRVRYDDADDGTGAAASVEERPQIGDCDPPVISAVRSRRISSSDAVVEWETDEPATSEVVLAPSGAVFSSTALTIDHSVIVTGLSACATPDFTVASADAGGNIALDDNAGSAYTFSAARDIEIYHEGFEGSVEGWTHAGNPDEWEFGAPLAGPPGPFAGTTVAGTDLAGDYDKSTDSSSHEMVLEMPPVSLEGLQAASLSLMQFYAFSNPAGGDGAFVEVNDGTGWMPLVPVGGYPGGIRVDHEWNTRAAFIGTTGVWKAATFDLGAFLGRHVRIRFVVRIDHGTRARAAGWYLDEVRVTGIAECSKGILTLDRAEYGCGPSEARLTLADSDLDQSAGTAETALVQATGATWSVPVTLTETGLSTGVFSGSLGLAPAAGMGGEVVSEGDRIAVQYADADDGSGAPALVEAEAGVGDCAAPSLSRIRVQPATNGTGLRIRWSTSEPASGEAAVTTASGTLRASSLDLQQDHEAIFTGLTDCEPYSLVLAAVDEAGNRAEASGAAPPMSGEVSRRVTIFSDDMEGVNPGWSHLGLMDEWERGIPLVGPPGAFSGARVFGTDLDGLYQAGADATLLSPPIDLRGETSATLAFWHYFDVFADGSPNADDDGAWVEVQTPSSGTTYIVPVDGYNNTIDRDANPPIPPGSGVFAGNSAGYIRAEYDLTPFVGQVIALRFRHWNDAAEGIFNLATGAGWYIDDVGVTAPRRCFGRPGLTSAVPASPPMQGASGIAVAITGTRLRAPLALDAGAGIVFRNVQVASAQSVTALADIAPGAPAVQRTLTLTNPDGQTATLAAAFSVTVDPAGADLDGSGGIDGRDFTILARAFGAFAGESRYLAGADLNADGVVDGRDLAVFGAHFGEILPP